jgi:hypothetical protein
MALLRSHDATLKHLRQSGDSSEAINFGRRLFSRRPFHAAISNARTHPPEENHL